MVWISAADPVNNEGAALPKQKSHYALRAVAAHLTGVLTGGADQSRTGLTGFAIGKQPIKSMSYFSTTQLAECALILALGTFVDERVCRGVEPLRNGD